MLDQRNLPEIIREILSERSPIRLHDEQFSCKRAGVLIPLFEEESKLGVLFTKRTDKMEHHKGQISFPGGSMDEKDGSIEETILREVDEEVGVSREHVDFLGRVDDIFTLTSNFVVHPFVGLVPHPYDFTINPEEVEKLIRVPLSVFHPENSEIKTYSMESEGVIYQSPVFEWKGDLIWGATAMMMENFMEIIGPALPLLEEMK